VYSWSYNINLQTGETLSSTVPSGSPSGDYFTIYDIPGLTANAVTVPSGWTATVQLLGTTPSTINLPDSATLENVTFFYTGSTPIVGSGQTIGSFVYDSTSGTITLGNFSAQTENTATGGVDQQDGPAGIDIPASSLPEPASFGLIGGSLIALSFFSRRLLRRVK
jgi:hypothetical protein